MELSGPLSGLFWPAFAQVVFINLVLSADNAVVMALATRALPPRTQWQALAWGALVVVLARVVLTLAVSIPLVIFFAVGLARLMARWPVIIVIGAGLLGWVAGGLLVSDPLWQAWIDARLPWLHFQLIDWTLAWTQILGAMLVVVLGMWLARRRAT